MSSFTPARRITDLPPYLFAELDRKVAAKRAEGADVVSFGVADPDFPTPPHIVEALRDAVSDPSTHHYPSYAGSPELREAIAVWMQRRFRVGLDPNTEVLPILGSKEGIVHLPWALVDEGDVALCADPGYPPYDVASRLAGGEPVALPLTREDGFLPRLDDVGFDVARRAKVMFLDYPGNPTGATCELGSFEQAVDFCRSNGIVLAHDAAYSEITYDGYVAPSVLQAEGAKDVAVEFHSFSKTYNMTGWRIGWVCGNADVVEALGRLKTNLDSGIFNAIQRAAIAALQGPMDFLEAQMKIFAERRDRAVHGLRDAGLDAWTPKGSFYLWVPVPEHETSTSFSTRLLDDAAVVVAPGNGYGERGEGYVRFSLTLPDDRLDEGIARIRKVCG
ncbi:MAG: LL-diaminopimelate aminotransferase [Actinomycetota bacterium]